MAKVFSVIAFSLLAIGTSARADFAIATFEDVPTGPSGVKVDFSPTGAFTSGGLAFNNEYTPPSPPFDGYFAAFGVSSLVDNVLVNAPGTIQDFDHQYGAYAPKPAGGAGTGSGGSATYGVVYNYFEGHAIVDLPTGYNPFSIDIANTTYVASAVKYGDRFSRAFRSGDFLSLDVIGYADAGGSGPEIARTTIYLADARGGSLILLDHFQTLDLTSLKGAKSLSFHIDSNVANSFGISVPFEFAVDNVTAIRAVPEPAALIMLLMGAGIVTFRRFRQA